MTNVRRFLRYLEAAGIVSIPDGVEPLDDHLEGFAAKLDAAGYSRSACAARLSQARHFAEWIWQSSIPAAGIDRTTIEQFAGHDCRCGIRTKRGTRVAGSGSADRRRGARPFVDFLRGQGAILPAQHADARPADPRLTGFGRWLHHERGATAETIRRYRHEAGRWLGRLDAAPKHWDAAAIRSIVLDQGSERSRSSVRMTVTVLRALLRFLVSEGQCAPSLVHAVPPAVRRRLSIIPRTIPDTTIEAIVAACGTGTPVEIRARAIILLLARMGLRAGDVWQLRSASAKVPSIAGKRITPHVLRHSCAMHTLQATGDIRKVALWLGHAGIQTTEMYLRADPAEKLALLNAHHPPLLKPGRFREPSDKLMAVLAATARNPR